MFILLRILLLIIFAKLVRNTGNALLCAITYTVIATLFAFLGGASIQALIPNILISFIASLIYFWLLVKTEDSIVWWFVLLLGFFIGVI